MFTDEALALLQRTAVKASEVEVLEAGDIPTLITRDRDTALVSIEHLYHKRSRYRGRFVTNTLAELLAYIAARQGEPLPFGPAVVFIDSESGSAETFFNLGTVANPGHGDDRGSLNLRRTAGFKAMLDFTAAGKQHKQRQVAEWLEDWFEVITPLYPENAGVTVPSLTAAIAAIRDITVAARGEHNSVQGDMAASRSVMEEVEAKSKKVLPVGFVFKVAPFDGFEVRTFALRLAVLPQEKEPLLSLRLVGLDDVKEKIAQEFETRVRDGVTPTTQVHRGVFTP
jgi:uncharacterized protein YfdQ (DUF2303 family)